MHVGLMIEVDMAQLETGKPESIRGGQLRKELVLLRLVVDDERFWFTEYLNYFVFQTIPIVTSQPNQTGKNTYTHIHTHRHTYIHTHF